MKETNLPFFTIVTPSFNSEKYISESIQSILSQTYKNFEYFIIDGGSTDHTNQIINSFSEYIDYSISEKDNGMYDALNKGFKRGKGDIFCYINSDDLLLPNTLAIVSEIFLNNNYDLIYGDMNIINENGAYQYTHCYRDFIPKEFTCHIPALIGQPSAFWRRSVFKSLNSFDISFKMASDYDFFAKLIIDGKYSIKYFPIAFSSLRVHNQALSFKFKENNLKEVANIRERYKYNLLLKTYSIIVSILNKFISLFRYDFARLFFITNLKNYLPKKFDVFIKILRLRLLSFSKYFFISKKAKIIFNKNSNLYIGKGVKIMDNVTIILSANSSLYIGPNTVINKNTAINVKFAAYIGKDSQIQENCTIGKFNFDFSSHLFGNIKTPIYIPNNSLIKSNKI